MSPKPLLAALVLLGSLSTTFAQLVIPSDGSDGAFNPTASVEVDLSQAVTGVWSNSNAGNAGKGIYDPEKWAIVFKYSSVNIPAGVTVTFKNHPTHAPVVWLVQGNVTVAGSVSLDGRNGRVGTDAATPTEPGPGGFRGGAFGPNGGGAGLGPGGGTNAGGNYNSAYGNPAILPLIGGSGAAAAVSNFSGASAGGAILIACSSTLNLSGGVTAKGGILANGDTNPTFRGSGGGIKLIAHSVLGNGVLDADTKGRIRVEANSFSSSILTTPSTIAFPPGTTPIIFQSNNSPTVRVVSVDGVPSPADPTAPLVSSADIAIQKNTPVTVVLETRNFATAGAVVSLRIANKFGGATTVNATLDNGGTSAVSTWRVNTTLAPGFVTLQARATAP